MNNHSAIPNEPLDANLLALHAFEDHGVAWRFPAHLRAEDEVKLILTKSRSS